MNPPLQAAWGGVLFVLLAPHITGLLATAINVPGRFLSTNRSTAQGLHAAKSKPLERLWHAAGLAMHLIHSKMVSARRAPLLFSRSVPALPGASIVTLGPAILPTPPHPSMQRQPKRLRDPGALCGLRHRRCRCRGLLAGRDSRRCRSSLATVRPCRPHQSQ